MPLEAGVVGSVKKSCKGREEGRVIRSLQDVRNNVMDVTVLSRCSGYARILNLFCAYIHTSRCGTRAGVNIKEVRGTVKIM